MKQNCVYIILCTKLLPINVLQIQNSRGYTSLSKLHAKYVWNKLHSLINTIDRNIICFSLHKLSQYLLLLSLSGVTILALTLTNHFVYHLVFFFLFLCLSLYHCTEYRLTWFFFVSLVFIAKYKPYTRTYVHIRKNNIKTEIFIRKFN